MSIKVNSGGGGGGNFSDGNNNSSSTSSSIDAKKYERFDVKVNMATAIKDYVDIASHKVSFVIGKRGTAINAIMDQSGCRVAVEPDQQKRTRRVTIAGNSKEGILKAKDLINRVLVEGPGFLVPLSQIDIPHMIGGDVIEDRSDDIMVPHAKVSTVIGSKGVIVEEIYRRTGCKVHILQEGCAAGADRPTLFIGTAEQIAEAKALVILILRDGANALSSSSTSSSSSSSSSSSLESTALGIQVDEEDIEQSHISIVIGARGIVIGNIMNKSNGCKIMIKQKSEIPEGTSPKVVYTGTPEQNSLAKYLVALVKEKGPSALDAMPNPTSQSSSSDGGHFAQDILIVTKSQINSMSGNSGLINNLQKNLRVTVQFEPISHTFSLPDPQSRVVINGDPYDVRAARNKIDNFVSQFNINLRNNFGGGAGGGGGGGGHARSQNHSSHLASQPFNPNFNPAGNGRSRTATSDRGSFGGWGRQVGHQQHYVGSNNNYDRDRNRGYDQRESRGGDRNRSRSRSRSRSRDRDRRDNWAVRGDGWGRGNNEWEEGRRDRSRSPDRRRDRRDRSRSSSRGGISPEWSR